MGMGNNGGNAASDARRQEYLRQSRVQNGMQQINSIFGGGSYGVNPVANFNNKQLGSYFTGSGTNVNDLTLSDPGFAQWVKVHNPFKGAQNNQIGAGPSLPRYDPVASVLFGNADPTPGLTMAQAKSKYANYLSQTGGLFGGTQKTPGFDDNFYNQRRDAYVGYALPQLASQYNQTQRDATFNLANKGLLQSDAGTQLRNSLEKERQLQTQGVADTAQGQVNDLRTNVENQRGALVNQLNASGDPVNATQSALSTAANFQSPSAYQPLGNLFTNWANMYLAKQYTGQPNVQTNAGYGYNPYQQQNQQPYGPSIVGSSSRIIK